MQVTSISTENMTPQNGQMLHKTSSKKPQGMIDPLTTMIPVRCIDERALIARMVRVAAVAAIAIASCAVDAQAIDTLRVASSQRGRWDTTIAEIGQRGGIFARNGLSLEILYTQGPAETRQAVSAGNADVGVGPGVMQVLAAFAKGAPLRVIGAGTTGAGELFWYVPANSPIRSLRDTERKAIAYSHDGSLTQRVLAALIQENDLKARPTATGEPPPTLSQAISGRIDVGWSAPPFALQLVEDGKLRIIASGNDAAMFKKRTVRVIISNATALQQRKPAIERFMKAYRETIDWLYSDDPAALLTYADFVGIPLAVARRTRDQFFPRAAIDPDRIAGLDRIVEDAAALEFTPAALSAAQLAELIRIPPRQ